MGDLSKNFSRYEFACKDGCGFDTVDAELIRILQDLRDESGRSISINSGCRCSAYNAREDVGGFKYSQHMKGKAADIVVSGWSAGDVQEYFSIKYPNKYGVGSYNTFTHIDSRSGKARW